MNTFKAILLSMLAFAINSLPSFAVQIAKPGERIYMLGEHKCFSYTERLIVDMNRLGWTNARSLKDVQKCEMGAIRLFNGQSIWIDENSIINVSPMYGGPMLCFDFQLNQKWRSRKIGYCTPYGR